jgi:hypothetical protein
LLFFFSIFCLPFFFLTLTNLGIWKKDNLEK